MLLLNVLIILLLFLIILFALLYFYYREVKKSNKSRHLQGLLCLNSFRHLLALIQQHRGLTMGYINGDHSLLNRIHSLKHQVNQQLSDIKKEQLGLASNLIWIGINDHWLRLSSHFAQYESDHNFRQHCNLIVNLQHLIEDSAEQHHLQELVCSNKQNANFLWNQLLNTAEHVGQARAVGTSIAAAKKSTSIQRIKLNYLKNYINVFLSNENLSSDAKSPRALLTAINNQILIDNPNIAAEEFFNLATAALDVIFGQFDDYLKELLSDLKDQ
tara:strand:- start:1986 stop:2801 length:816 start_codon:yes stop_codon:yes gene_type:complete